MTIRPTLLPRNLSRHLKAATIATCGRGAHSPRCLLAALIQAPAILSSQAQPPASATGSELAVRAEIAAARKLPAALLARIQPVIHQAWAGFDSAAALAL